MWLPPSCNRSPGIREISGTIFDYFRDSKNVALGASYGFGLMGRELPFMWIRGNDVSPLGFVVTGEHAARARVPRGHVRGRLLAARRGTGRRHVLPILVTGAAVVGDRRGRRINGIPGSYLMRWWWVVGRGLVVFARLVGVADSCDRAIASRRAFAWIGAAVVAVALGGRRDRCHVRPVPEPEFSACVRQDRRRLQPHCRKAAYLVTWIDSRDSARSASVCIST